jgi:hypothetical protein
LAAFAGLNLVAANAERATVTAADGAATVDGSADAAAEVATAANAYLTAWSIGDYEVVMDLTSTRCQEIQAVQGMAPEAFKLLTGIFDGATVGEAAITGQSTANATIEGFTTADLGLETPSSITPTQTLALVLEGGKWVIDECDATETTTAPPTAQTSPSAAPEMTPTLPPFKVCQEAYDAGESHITPDHPRWQPELDGHPKNGVGCEHPPWQ